MGAGRAVEVAGAGFPPGLIDSDILVDALRGVAGAITFLGTVQIAASQTIVSRSGNNVIFLGNVQGSAGTSA